MAVELKIPQSGESISEVQIGEWRKSEGDQVEQDEIVVEIETDKASMELPAPSSGVISKIAKKSGEMAEVGEVIAYIEEGAEASKKKKPEKKKPAEEAPPQKQEEAEKEAEEPEPDEAEDEEESKADKRKGDGKKDEKQKEEEEPVPAQVEVRPRVMPSAQRALAEHGLRAEDVRGTGPGGRVLKEDVQRHVRRAGEQRESASTAAARRQAEEREEEAVPMTMLRRRIAERLVDAQHTAALLTTFNEVDMTEVMALRKKHGEAFRERYDVKLGIMSFFVKAAIEALKRVPQVNAEIRGTDIIYKNYFDIAVAVATDHGLVVPVLRDADRLSFAQTEKAIGELADRARQRKLSLEELQGGTFTISNGGVYGSLLSTPIVNPPQSGILGLHTIQDRPVARDGQVVIRPMMYLALTYDHRLIDGREGVVFLKTIKESIEDPARLILEI